MKFTVITKLNFTCEKSVCVNEKLHFIKKKLYCLMCVSLNIGTPIIEKYWITMNSGRDLTTNLNIAL